MDIEAGSSAEAQKINYPVTFVLRLIMTACLEEEADANHVLAILDRNGIRYGGMSKEKNDGSKYYKLKIPCTIETEAAFQELYSSLSRFEKIKAAI